MGENIKEKKKKLLIIMGDPTGSSVLGNYTFGIDENTKVADIAAKLHKSQGLDVDKMHWFTVQGEELSMHQVAFDNEEIKQDMKIILLMREVSSTPFALTQ